MRKNIILALLLILNSIAYSKGIIIGHDDFILKTFRDNKPEQIVKLAESLSSQYDKIILNISGEYSFNRGGFFFYKTSKENLRYFSDTLNKNKSKLYIWMLNSFGSSEFDKLYKSYAQYIQDNMKQLESLGIEYDGVVLDIEWINLNSSSSNNEKYIELIKNVKKILRNKKLLVFYSLIEDQQENIKRGFNESELKKYIDIIIPMLYIRDGGFYEKEDILYPYINTERIESLRKYYDSKGYFPAISIESGIVIQRNNNFYFIRTILSKKESFFDNLSIVNSKETNYYKTITYKAKNNFKIEKNDKTYETISKDETIFLLIVKPEMVKNSDFTWEFNILNDFY